MGGFHIHVRVGLDTEYLGSEFMDCVKACVEKARREGLLVWLYDEDRWPSGAAGGLVTQDPRFRQRLLLFTPDARRPEAKLASYGVTLKDGRLAAYRTLLDCESLAAGERGWFAYCVQQEPISWFNGQTYLDTLNPEAVAKFIETTHEAYKRAVGKDFGGVIPAMFTDEPQFSDYGVSQSLAFAAEAKELRIPYTDDFPESYRAAHGVDFFSTLPELFWELPAGKLSPARHRYHDHAAERFVSAFSDTLGKWCGENHLCLTGHLMTEPFLGSQTLAVGEAMRHYRAFQLPGIDLLGDTRGEYTTAKQAQSVARQYGRPGVLSELYGVTGWDFDFAGHKAQGDWQAALGITVRVQHLSWVSMLGEAKRDYPASIFHQSPWYRRYRVVEDHFARLNAALTRGTPVARVGLLHPLESYWLVDGPLEQTAVARAEQEGWFQDAINWLLFGQLDFDYLSESLLPRLCQAGDLRPGSGFRVGEAAYDVVVVPPLLTMRSSTLERLRAFAQAGGRVLFAGPAPGLVDALPSEDARDFAATRERIAFSKGALLDALESLRDVDVRLAGGARFDKLFYQLRQDGANRILFLCDTEQRGHSGQDCQVMLKGEWALELLDTHSGAITPLAADYADGKTCFEHTFFPHGHLLLRLRPGRREQGLRPAPQVCRYQERDILVRFPERVPVALSEPNALLLDQAEWRLNGGPWRPKEELLRVGAAARKTLGLGASFDGGMVQPWVAAKEGRDDKKVQGTLELRFSIDSETAVAGARLAAELAVGETIAFDGEPIATQPDGWWVDEAITTVPLPAFAAGKHELLLRIPLTRAFSLEWCYLLGDFGVSVAGRGAKIIPGLRELAFGDITRQGLPFYTGNITYHCPVGLPGDELTLSVPRFRGAMIDVAVDGRALTPIAFSPYRCRLDGVGAGERTIDLTLYGTRGNAFNPLHWTGLTTRVAPGACPGPEAWRTGGDDWTYEYRLLEMGILSTPALVRQTNGK